MDKIRIAYLHQRYLEGTLSREENAEWEQLIHNDDDAELRALMQTTWLSITPESQQSMPHRRAQRMFKRIVQRSRIRTLTVWLPVAAALVIVATVAWLLLDTAKHEVAPQLAAQDFSPGGNRATLTLDNGATIALSEKQDGIVVDDWLRYADGTAVLNETEPNPNSQTYQLSTPIGGMYQLTLPDGSKVWLNAASTLRYPRRFADGERRVEIDGEAYFSVVKDGNRPFIVVSREQHITVMGTEFNINAYADEQETTTTLVTGRVEVAAAGNTADGRAASEALIPGRQSTVRQGRIDVKTVDTDEFTAWREGRFNFNGKTLPQVMRELARWYNFRVAYEGKIQDIEFYGGIHRNRNLDLVMTLLETNGIRYRMDRDSTLVLSTVELTQP